MTLEDFKKSSGNPNPPDGLGPALSALWHDAHGDWDAAHRVAQEIEDPTGAWVQCVPASKRRGSAPFVDGQIAAIAHVHGLVLATTNDKGLRPLQGAEGRELVEATRSPKERADCRLRRNAWFVVAPVQAYIAAMPGWKREVGHRPDALIVRTVPDVRKAVKWKSPFYGIEGQGWFLNFHCFTK